MKKILILLLKLIGALFIVGTIGVFAIIIKYRLELPNMQSMVEDYKPQMATIIYLLSQGKLLNLRIFLPM